MASIRIKSVSLEKQMPTLGILPADINAELAKYARQVLAESIRDGTGSPRYEKRANGVLGADESSVRVPGDIFYKFHWWNEIVEFGLDSLRKLSPVLTGRYRDSWVALVNGTVTTDYSRIPIMATVILTNNVTGDDGQVGYARKIEVGFSKLHVPGGVVNASKVIIMGKYGNSVTAKTTMIPLPGGYVLKGRFQKGSRPQSRTKLRKDTMRGAYLKYPAIVLNMRE